MNTITKQLEKLAAAPEGTLRRIAKTWVLFVPKSYGEQRFLIDGQEFDIDGAVARLTQTNEGDAK
jgi:hypothetical protein